MHHTSDVLLAADAIARAAAAATPPLLQPGSVKARVKSLSVLTSLPDQAPYMGRGKSQLGGSAPGMPTDLCVSVVSVCIQESHA
jgi:hypothetical protein